MNMKIQNYSFLRQFENLTSLDLSYNKEIDLLIIQQIKLLTRLSLTDCELLNTSELGKLSNLQYLDISYNFGINISHLSFLSQLKCLNLSNCDIQCFGSLENQTNLEELDISDNSCSPALDISALKYLTNLVILKSNNNYLNNTIYLKYLVNLKELELNSCIQIDITPLQYLTQLTKLQIEQCDIYDISVLYTLINLEYLDISENNIIDLVPLFGMIKLTKLYINQNKVTDFTTIKSFPYFDQFTIEYQLQPTEEELLQSSFMNIIFKVTTLLREIRTQRFKIERKRNQVLNKTNILLEKQKYSQVYFSSNLVSIFQQLNGNEANQ
ncbi:T9SS_type A sorting domain-containing protein [Hexamita inflata]|uniref:T9SS type A sorting domain-containing protein n=1 Tax=Hexamita inflata TaxID=28002 RepID=A0AA86QBI9_9EUKA|nr:T9SS type A sorting domain-containing protein [Hexamita inflata]